MTKLKKTIRWDTAFDRTHHDPSKNYGIGSMRLTFALVGKEGAIQFALLTPFYLPHVIQKLSNSKYGQEEDDYFAIDLGYHSATPQYIDQKPISENCPYTGGICYYDGSGLRAETIYTHFTALGEEALWNILLDEYNSLFNTTYLEMTRDIESFSDV